MKYIVNVFQRSLESLLLWASRTLRDITLLKL